MVRRVEQELDPADRDERLGEAIEDYLSMAEHGHPPDLSQFVEKYPELGEDLRAALDGLELVRGLVGSSGGPGPGHSLESGRRVAGYKIVRELGRGGMGIVYEAVHVGLDRPVALKVLGTSAAPDSTGRRRFLNEARTAAGLHHTHIVPVFDVGQVGGLCYYAMQRIEGSGLDRVIKHLRRDRTVAAGSSAPGRTPIHSASPATLAGGLSNTGRTVDALTASWLGHPLDHVAGPSLDRVPRAPELEDEPTPFEPPRGSSYYRWVASVGRQAAEALAHAHQRGVIHRDVKPSNLLVDARGIVWMADFGLARRLADPSQTQADSLLGTPRYMSPEQSKIGPIDGRSDVYSLGATLYELLTLRPPFDGKTAAELIEQIALREPIPLRQFDRRLSRDLETIVLKALAKRPADRYASAQDLSDDLGRYLAMEPVKARRISPIGRAWRVARRHPSLTIVSTVAIIAVVGAWTTAYYRVVEQRDEAVAARKDAQQSAEKTELANQATRAALRTQLAQQATVQRLSSGANRRSTGLDFLKQAAALDPDANQRTKIRDEAAALLSLRDVVRSRVLPIERVSGLEAIDDGRIAVLSDTDDGSAFRIWDLAKGEPIGPVQEIAASRSEANSASGRGRGPGGGVEGGRDRERPEPPPGTAPVVPAVPPGPGRGRGPGVPRIRPSRLAVVGSKVAVVWPDGKGVRLFDAETAAVVGNLALAGREVIALHAVADGQRMVTVEVERAPAEDESTERGRGGRGRLPRVVGVRVNLWNPDQAVAPIATLATSKLDSGSTNGGLGGFPNVSTPLVAISPAGSTIAVSWMSESEITLFNRDGKKVDTIDAQVRISALAIGPHDMLAAAGNGIVQVWDPSAKAPRITLSPHLNAVSHLRFSPDNRGLLALAGFGSGVELWDLTTSSPTAVLPATEWVNDLAFTPSGQTLAITQTDAVAVWSVIDPAAQVRIAAPASWPNALDFSPGGQLVMSSRDEPPKYWKAGDCAISGGAGPTLGPGTVAYDATGLLLSVDDARLLRVAADTGKVESRIDLPKFRGEGLWNSVKPPISRMIAQTPDSKILAFARLGDVFAWSAAEPKKLRKIELRESESRPGGRSPGNRGGGGGGGAPGWVNLALSPSADRLYLLSFRNEVRAYSLNTSYTAERLPWNLADDGKFSSMALSPDGRTLALGERNGRVLLVSTATGRTIESLLPPEDDGENSVYSLAYSPNGRELAVGTRETIRLWSTGSKSGPEPLVRLPGHRGNVISLAYDASGRHLASGGDDKTVRVWDVDLIRKKLADLGLGW